MVLHMLMWSTDHNDTHRWPFRPSAVPNSLHKCKAICTAKMVQMYNVAMLCSADPNARAASVNRDSHHHQHIWRDLRADDGLHGQHM